jgi:hypothetical protein
LYLREKNIELVVAEGRSKKIIDSDIKKKTC